jgi:hypothetical protein
MLRVDRMGGRSAECMPHLKWGRLAKERAYLGGPPRETEERFGREIPNAPTKNVSGVSGSVTRLLDPIRHAIHRTIYFREIAREPRHRGASPPASRGGATRMNTHHVAS